MSKSCLIEAKIGKTISRSTMIAMSYLEGIDNCKNIRNIEYKSFKETTPKVSKNRSIDNLYSFIIFMD